MEEQQVKVRTSNSGALVAAGIWVATVLMVLAVLVGVALVPSAAEALLER